MNRRQKEQARLTCQISIGLMAGVFSVIPAASAAPVHDAGSSYNTVPAAKITTSSTVTNVQGPSTNNVVAWKDFSVGAKETVQFDGGAKKNNYLNVVTGQSTSQIAGKIQGGNDVYIVNPHGVMFGKGAQVDVGNLYVSTENTADAVNAFATNSKTGADVIKAGTANADVVNLGTLQAAEVQVSGKNIRFLDSAKVLDAGGAVNKKVTLDGTGYIHVGNSGGTDAGYTAGGTTKSIDYYQLVNDATDLQNVATNGLSKNYMLSDNIDMSGVSAFTPIGDSTAPFKGKFDGMFYAVEGLNVNTSNKEAGLFGSVNNARIENLGIVGATVTSTNKTGLVGGIVGEAKGSSVLKNLYSEADASGNGQISGGQVAGGLVGKMNSGTSLTTSYNATPVTSGTFAGGGLVGRIEDGSTITDAYNVGTVTAAGSAQKVYGIGYDPGTNVKVTRVYSTADGLDLLEHAANVSQSYNFNSTASSTNVDVAKAKNISTYETSAGAYASTPWSSSDISADGTTDTTWRIYEGQTTPMLTAFFQGTITADYNYNFFADSTDTTATSNGLSLAGLSSTANNGSDITATYNAQYLKIASSSDATKAGTTSDITFSGNVTGSDSNLAINTTGIRNVAVDGNNKAVQQSLIASGQHGYNIIGGGVLLNKRKVAATTGQKLTIKKEYDGTADGTDALGQALNGGSVGIGGLIAGDDVKLTGLTATYGSKGSEAAKDVEYGKPVSLTPSGTAALTGSSAGNYDFDASSLSNSNISVTGDITPRTLYASLTKTSGIDKTYDGTSSVITKDTNGNDTDAAASKNVQLDASNIVSINGKQDDVSIDTSSPTIEYYNGSSTVSDSNAATNTTSYDIHYTGLALKGNDARNYQLAVKNPSSTTGYDVIYDGYLAATGKTQTATGYLSATGAINQRPIDPATFVIVDANGHPISATKTYDGTSTYTLPSGAKIAPNGTSSLSVANGLVNGDDISFDLPANATANFQTSTGVNTSQVKDASQIAAGVQATAKTNTNTGKPTNLANYTWGVSGTNYGSTAGGTTLNAANTYDVTVTGATITPRVLQIVVNQQGTPTKTYDGNNKVLDADAATFNQAKSSVSYATGSDQIVTDQINGDAPTITVTPTYTDKNVARDSSGNVTKKGINYAVTLNDPEASNYELVMGGSTATGKSVTSLTFASTATGAQGQINPKQLTSSFTKITKTYDGTKNLPSGTTASGALSSGSIISGDNVTLSIGRALYQSENVNGDGTTTTINGATQKNWINYTGLSLSGTDAGNYEIAPSAQGEGEIKKLTLKAGDFDYTYSTPIMKEYDGTATVKNADTYLTGIKVKSKVSAKRDVFRDTTNPNNIINHTKDISATYNTPNSKGGAAQKLTYKATILDDGSGNFDFSALPNGIADTDTSATGTITARKVKAAPVSTLKKTYDATNTATATSTNPLVTYTYAGTQTGTQQGLISNGTVTDTDNSSAVYKDKRTGYNDADAGTTSDKTVAYTIGITTADATNYEVVDASSTNTVLYTNGVATTNTLSGAGEINKRKLTIKFGNTVKSWDGTDIATGNKTAVNATLDDATGNSDGKSGIVTTDGTNTVFKSNLSKIAGNYVNSSGQKQTDAGKGFTVNYSNIDDAFKSTSGTTTTDYGRNYDFSVTGTGTGDIDPLSITGSNLKLDFSGITKEYDGGNSVVGNGSATSYGAADYITTNWVDVDGDGKLTSADVILGGGSQNGPSSGLQSLISSATYDDAQGNAGTKQGVTYVLNLGNINNYSFGSGFSNVSTGSNATASFANGQLTAKTTGDITPRKVVATPVGTITKTYDGTKNLPSTAGTLISYTHYGTKGAGLVGSGDKDASTGAFTQSDAGSGNNLVTYNLAIHNAKNYEIVDSSGKATSTATGAGTINKRNLVINFGKTVKTWDGSDVATGNVTAINATLDDSNAAGNTDGKSGVVVTDGTDAVFQKNLSQITGQYLSGGKSQTDAGTNFDVQYSNYANAFIDALNNNTDYGRNYTITAAMGKGDINPLAISSKNFHLGFSGITKEYDATNQVVGQNYGAADYVTTNWVDIDGDGQLTVGKDVILGGSTAQGPSSGFQNMISSATYNDASGNAGTGKGVTYVLNLGNTNNYTFSSGFTNVATGTNTTATYTNGQIIASTTGDITKRKVVASVTRTPTKTYDGKDTLKNATTSLISYTHYGTAGAGLVGSDVDASTGKYTSVGAGTSTNKVQYQLAINNGSNYEIVDANGAAQTTLLGSGTINKAPLTIDFGYVDKTYNGKSDVTTSALTGDQTTITPTLNGFVNNENATFDATATNLISGTYVKWDAATKSWVADPHVNWANANTLGFKAVGYSNLENAFNDLALRKNVLANYELTGATDPGASVTKNANGIAQSVYFSEALKKGQIKPLALVMGDIADHWTTPITKEYDGTDAVKDPTKHFELYETKTGQNIVIPYTLQSAVYDNGQVNQTKGQQVGVTYTLDATNPFPPQTLGDFTINQSTQAAYQGKQFQSTGEITPKNIYVKLDNTQNITKEYNHSQAADPSNVKYYDSSNNQISPSSIIETRDQGKVTIGVKSALFDDENASIERATSASQNKRTITYTVDLNDATGEGNYVLLNTNAKTTTPLTSSVTDPVTGAVTTTNTTENTYEATGDIYRAPIKVKSNGQQIYTNGTPSAYTGKTSTGSTSGSWYTGDADSTQWQKDGGDSQIKWNILPGTDLSKEGSHNIYGWYLDHGYPVTTTQTKDPTTGALLTTTETITRPDGSILTRVKDAATGAYTPWSGVDAAGNKLSDSALTGWFASLDSSKGADWASNGLSEYQILSGDYGANYYFEQDPAQLTVTENSGGNHGGGGGGGNPSNPVNPTNPVSPTNPTNPVNPVTPVNPTNPSNPVTPTNPSNPSTPVVPSHAPTIAQNVAKNINSAKKFTPNENAYNNASHDEIQSVTRSGQAGLEYAAGGINVTGETTVPGESASNVDNASIGLQGKGSVVNLSGGDAMEVSASRVDLTGGDTFTITGDIEVVRDSSAAIESAGAQTYEGSAAVETADAGTYDGSAAVESAGARTDLQSTTDASWLFGDEASASERQSGTSSSSSSSSEDEGTSLFSRSYDDDETAARSAISVMTADDTESAEDTEDAKDKDKDEESKDAESSDAADDSSIGIESEGSGVNVAS